MGCGRMDESGKKVRFLVKTGEVIPNVIKPKSKPADSPEPEAKSE